MNVIQRLCKLRPNSWKSDPQLNQKHTNRYDVKQVNPNEKSNNIVKSQPLSKSSDWTEVDLEVPEKEEQIHLRNPQLSLIFSKENGTPTPPPRKVKKNFREKIEAVAKNGLQAFQSKKPVEEPICVKKKINYKCPLCDEDEATHNRDHHHHHNHRDNPDNNKKVDKQSSNSNDKKSFKEDKRRKNLSVVSLPNYNELKLTVTHFDDIDKPGSGKENSLVSLPTKAKKSSTGSTGKLDSYITRCRSFGSLLPQQLKKLRSRKADPADVESDDSFGALEDWDLGLIEHYNPKDASLPRPRKIQRNSKDVISGIESLIVKEENIEKPKPKPPVRRSESLVKKISREGAESAQKRSDQIPNESGIQRTETKSVTPPSSPTPESKPQERVFIANLPTKEDGKVEHSSLIKILEQFSIKDKQDSGEIKNEDSSTKNNSNQSSLTPSLLEFEKNIAVNTIEDFITAEKLNTERELNISKQNPTAVS